MITGEKRPAAGQREKTMLEFVTIEQAGELDGFVLSHPRCHYMQTSYWGKIKSDWLWRGILSRGEDGKIRGTAAVLLHKMRGTPFHMLYAPRGPICDWEDGETFEELLEGIRQLGRKFHGYLFRMDPQLLDGDEENKERLEKLGFTVTPIDDFNAFQARVVYQIEIGGRTEEEMLMDLPRKTRYGVRSAERKGVEVRVCGEEALPDFCRMMDATAERQHFSAKSESYFKQFLDCMGDHARLYMGYYEGEAISGAIAVQMGGKTWYAYSCADEAHRDIMGGYLVQWHLILWAIQSGCSLYDLRGVEGFPTPDNPMAGLHHFKQSFGSHMVVFMGQMDLPLRKDWKLIQGAQELYGKLRK